MNITAKLTNILGLRKQPQFSSTGSGNAGGAASVSVQKVRGIAAKNKLTIGVTLAVLLIAGSLYGLRQVSTNLRGMRITPNDPNLYKTVKTSVGKSSMVTSFEAEINNNNLNGQEANPEVSLIAKKFIYRPLGTMQPKRLLDTGNVKTTIPVALSAVTAPTVKVAPPKERVIVRTVRPRSKQSKIQQPDDPFNTVHVGTDEAVAQAVPAPTAAPSMATVSTSREAEGSRYIPAVVYGKQSIRSGGKARFRTTEAVTFQKVYIPRNTILTAVAYLGAGRIQFQVPARIIAGQKLPVDLMCVDKDYQTGITYNYDYIDDNMRQVGGSTVNSTADAATSLLPYGSALGVAGNIGSSAVRGITNAITSGKRQRSTVQVEIQDGYQVFFKSTKN